MPELPEVETIVNDLKPVLTGLSFKEILTSQNSMIFSDVDFFKKIENKKVIDINRRGKFITIFFENNFVLTVHLRMTGRLLIKGLNDPALKYERVRINFNKRSLRFCDLRKFGRVWLCSKNSYEDLTGISKLGIEPLSKNFTFKVFRELVANKEWSVKRLLLDQSLIAGIGNIYADEAAFYAGIRPETNVSKLDKNALNALYKGILRALNQGVRNRGTSISDFEDAFGNIGQNQEVLYVYGRGGKKCLRCQRILKKTKLVGRGTVYCFNCQN